MGVGIIQKQDGDANCTFIQRGQVPTFEGGKCPSPHISYIRFLYYVGDKQPLP